MNQGSPLAARQGSLIYIFIVAVIIGIVVLSIIGLILLATQRRRNSKEWIEKNKSRETNKKDVGKVAREADLDQAEKDMLWTICRKNHAKNIEYLYRDAEQLESLFAQGYSLVTKNRTEEKVKCLFKLKFKLDKTRDMKLAVSSTKNLPEGQEFFCIDESKHKWTITLAKSDNLGMFLELPPEMYAKGIEPKPLSKFILGFKLYNRIAYKTVVRATRYEIKANEQKYLFVPHSQDVKMLQRRSTMRMDCDIPCEFAAFKMAKDKKNNDVLEVQEKKYKGKIVNISAGGCRIVCALPILKDQSLQLFFGYDNEEVNARGLIVTSKKGPAEGLFALHVKFEEIDLRIRNKINAAVYNYQ